MTTPKLADTEIADMLREIERDGDRIVHMWDARAIVALVREAEESRRASRASSPAEGKGANCPDCGRERTVYKHCGSSRHIASAPLPAPAEATQPPEREADEAMVKAVESETSAALRYWQQGTHDVLDRPARASLLARLDDLRRDRDEAAAALGMSQEAMEVCVDCENAMRDRAEEAERAAAVERESHAETRAELRQARGFLVEATQDRNKLADSRDEARARADAAERDSSALRAERDALETDDAPRLCRQLLRERNAAVEQEVALRERVEALELAMHTASLIKCPACPGNDSNGHADRCWWGVILHGTPGPEYDGARASLSPPSPGSPARASGAEDAATEPACVCGHPFLAHVTVHLGGCIGRPDGPCGPDCRDECMEEQRDHPDEKCECREYVPGPAALPAPRSETTHEEDRNDR